MTESNMKILLIEWQDATQIRDVSIQNFNGKIAPMKSVGFVLEETEGYITLVRDVFIGTPDMYRKVISIPRSSFINEPREATTDDNYNVVDWEDYTFNSDGLVMGKDRILKEIKARRVMSVGFIVAVDKEKISITGDIDTHKDVAKYVQTIPKSSMLKGLVAG